MLNPETNRVDGIRRQLLELSHAQPKRLQALKAKSKSGKLNQSLVAVAAQCTLQDVVSLLTAAGKAMEIHPKLLIPHGVEALLDALVEKDPAIESLDPMPVLKLCAAGQIRHDGFVNAVSKCFARQLPILRLEDALLWLDTLANVNFQMQESTKLALEKSVEILLTTSQQEIMAQTEDVTMVARALRRLRLQAPRTWLSNMMQVLTTRIELLVMVAENREGMETGTVKQVAACVLCLGHLQYPIPDPSRVFEAITYACASGDESDLVAIARGIQRLDRVIKVPRYVWNALDRCTVNLISTFDDQDVCRVLHSFGKCQIRPRKLLPVVTAQVIERSDGLTMHQVSILLWSFAMLSRVTPVSDGATAALARQADALIQGSQYSEGRQHTVDMANIAWAVVSLRHSERNIGEFVERAMKCCRPIQSMSVISIAIMLWACAQSQAQPYQLSLYTRRIGQVVKEAESIQISTIIWSFGKLNEHPGIELMESLLAALSIKMSAMDTQGIGDAIWACGSLGHHPGALVGAVLADLQRRGAEYSKEAWSAIIWGLTQVGEDTANFLKLAHHAIDEKRVRYDLRLVATMMWSAAIFEHFQTPVYRRMLGLLYTFSDSDLDPASKSHIREAHMLGVLSGQYREQDLSPLVQMDDWEYWKAVLMHQDLGRHTLSQLSLVRQTLRSLQIPYLSFYPLTSRHEGYNGKGLQSIMIDRPYGRNRQVAVEFLSPNMLTVNTHQPKWRARFRAACLCALGFDVLWLPYLEWEAAVARNRQEEFLYSRIHKLLGTV